MPWYRELELERHGVRYLEPELNVCLLPKEGEALEWWTDFDRTVSSFARFSRRDAEALRRWPLEACLIIHRYGRLEPGERIVMVATASAHRQAALEACAYLIDWLKTKAPFWKLEETAAGAKWVDARDSDSAATKRWIEE
ncbi:MAG: molybdenum cofactor biosynthesis protein MoaE [Proteobacteria bacterium]|nr:molybdenum cofactor biosynthesis protein MoaE [Pseudomonadota bacterium]